MFLTQELAVNGFPFEIKRVSANPYKTLTETEMLRKLGYRRINFLNHRYFMMYRIEDNVVYIDNIFHEL